MHHFCKKILLNMFIVIMGKKASYRGGGRPVYKELMLYLEEMLNFETVNSSTVQF